MTISTEIRRCQRDWASARGLSIDRRGYVDIEQRNLYLELSKKFSLALDGAGGGERQKQRHRPAKILALHSSAVLAINVFQYWEGRKGFDLPRAIGVDGSLADVNIERKYPSGLKGTPPTLDVVLTLANDRLIAIESKFTEWMTKKPVKLEDFSSKYLSSDSGHWVGCDLPDCQRLAADIASGKESFRQLDALQLLKHALGLQKNVAGRFSLLYLYYDYEGESDLADLHRKEVARFASLVDTALGFQSMSYQQLFTAVSGQPGIDGNYLNYMRERYFPAAS
jgi:hypothetical protein